MGASDLVWNYLTRSFPNNPFSIVLVDCKLDSDFWLASWWCIPTRVPRQRPRCFRCWLWSGCSYNGTNLVDLFMVFVSFLNPDSPREKQKVLQEHFVILPLILLRLLAPWPYMDSFSFARETKVFLLSMQTSRELLSSGLQGKGKPSRSARIIPRPALELGSGIQRACWWAKTLLRFLLFKTHPQSWRADDS